MNRDDTITFNTKLQTVVFEADDVSMTPDTMYGNSVKCKVTLFNPTNPDSCVIQIGENQFTPDDIEELLETANKMKQVANTFKE